VPTTGRHIRTPAGGGIEHGGSCCIDGDRPAGSLEGPNGSPRLTLSFDAVRPPRPIAVSPNTMSDTRFPAAFDTVGRVDSRLEIPRTAWEKALLTTQWVKQEKRRRDLRRSADSAVGGSSHRLWTERDRLCPALTKQHVLIRCFVDKPLMGALHNNC
jgi:hypothetical protein